MIIKRLYKDIDISQKFIQINNQQDFEKIENEKNIQGIITKQPEHIPTSTKELQKKQQPQQKIDQQSQQQIIQLKSTKNTGFFRIMGKDILPYHEIYELKDNDLIFIKDFNEKYKTNITQEYLEQLIGIFELKSGKNFVVSWIDMKDNFTQEEINKYSLNLLEKIYIYWKQARDIYGFPLLRINQRPNYNDKDPRIAFRPRVPEKMKLRKNLKQNDEESYLKLVTLKEEMNRYQLLSKQLILREKYKMQLINQTCANFLSEIYKLEKNYYFLFEEKELFTFQDLDSRKNEIDEDLNQIFKQKQDLDKEYLLNIDTKTLIELSSLKQILQKKNSELVPILSKQQSQIQTQLNGVNLQQSHSILIKNPNLSSSNQNKSTLLNIQANTQINQVTNAVLFQIRSRVGRSNIEFIDKYFEENTRYQDLANYEANYKFNVLEGNKALIQKQNENENQEKNKQENKSYSFSQLDKNKFNKQYFLNIKRKYSKYFDFENFIENESEENKNLKRNISNAIKEFERKKSFA
ncbi:hypothetical protein IMG5_079250 [Ichthyophthirius multifiliis]|uniref:Uncharacterized protein n=1 Tax=Ichthyophthirius multifiliis TaxID=5932 RepID=G0QQH9_ICHMU|nr:hypothetical protein IMG5_079250 [Ichthyophthirius multifiliis]EGR32525.1 hypothetical protein IMG5_079250 [Ichthyophthirius multifiliis]|eukprot:XP_004036511.1 hypothetical protein IMG5_079250 [Ichthyophthirius multifiliis]